MTADAIDALMMSDGANAILMSDWMLMLTGMIAAVIVTLGVLRRL